MLNPLYIPSWPHWLKVKIIITVVWYSLYSLAMAAPLPPYCVIINADSKKIGMSYVTESRNWGQLATEVRKFPGIHLKHPFGFWPHETTGEPDMVFDQASRLKEYLAAHPDEPHIAQRADFTAFVDAWANRPARQFLSIYVGRLGSLRGITLDDTPQTIADRAYAELAPIVAACPNMICFDNDYPRDEQTTALSYLLYGPEGAQVLLHKRLREDGIKVGLEPAPARGIARSRNYWYVFSDNFAKQVQGKWETYQGGKFTDVHAYPCFFEYRGQDPAVVKASMAAGEIPMVFLGQLTPELREALK